MGRRIDATDGGSSASASLPPRRVVRPADSSASAVVALVEEEISARLDSREALGRGRAGEFEEALGGGEDFLPRTMRFSSGGTGAEECAATSLTLKPQRMLRMRATWRARSGGDGSRRTSCEFVVLNGMSGEDFVDRGDERPLALDHAREFRSIVRAVRSRRRMSTARCLASP